jgi:hypothetical protein
VVYKIAKKELTAQRSIERGGQVWREALAAMIDRAIGLDVVPATIVRDADEGLGSLQEWVVGRTVRKEDMRNERTRKEMMKVALLDYLTNNSDRHTGNFLVAPDGGVKAIDNGLTFPRVTDGIVNGIRSTPMEWTRGLTLEKETTGALRAALASTELMAELRNAFRNALGDESDTQWLRFLARMTVAARDEWTIPNTEWRSDAQNRAEPGTLPGENKKMTFQP